MGISWMSIEYKHNERMYIKINIYLLMSCKQMHFTHIAYDGWLLKKLAFYKGLVIVTLILQVMMPFRRGTKFILKSNFESYQS